MNTARAARVNVQELAERYRLALREVPRRGRAGEVLGRGAGSSLEFQDHRNYSVGDDVRHIDWRALARTDQVMVRVYREELRPRLELLIDASRSMGTDPAKKQCALDLARFFARVGAAGGIEVRCIALGDEPRPLGADGPMGVDAIEGQELACDGRTPLSAAIQAAAPFLGHGCLRLVISDFLAPKDARELVRPLATRAGALVLVQVLSEADAEPRAGEALRLTDAETDETADVWIDAAVVARYRARLAALVQSLDVEARRAGGRFFSITAGETLEVTCARRFVPAGLLEPA